MPFKKGQSGNPAGKPKGANKATVELRDMILNALDKVGGEEYLARQAVENPGPFMTLVGKVLPVTVNATVHKPVTELTEDELKDRLGRVQAALAARAGANRGATVPASGSERPH